MVIAALLNHIMKPHGIGARMTRRDRTLHVMLESIKPLNRRAIAEFVLKSVQSLHINSIDAIVLYWRPPGKTVVWKETMPVQAGADLEIVRPSEHLGTVPSVASLDLNNSAIVADISFATDPDQTAIVESNSSTVPTSPLSTPPFSMSPTNTPISDEFASDLPPAIAPAPDLPLLPNVEAPLLLPSAREDDPEMAEWLNRPEALIFIIFAVLVTLWQFYIDLMDEETDGSALSGRTLARRLGVNSSTISRRKEREDFSQWTQDLDPDGIAWMYCEGRFVPIDAADETGV